MEFLDGLLGDASKIDPRRARAEFACLLGATEGVQHAFRLGADCLLFADRRLVIAQRPLRPGDRFEYLSLPYRSITHFSVEAPREFAREARLCLWVVGRAAPVQKRFGTGACAYEVQALLAAYVLG